MSAGRLSIQQATDIEALVMWACAGQITGCACREVSDGEAVAAARRLANDASARLARAGRRARPAGHHIIDLRAAPPTHSQPPPAFRDWKDLAAFYDERRERCGSIEWHFGVHWRDGWPGHEWRVSCIKSTGEVYAVQLRGNPPGPVQLLGAVPVDSGEVWHRTAGLVLAGWADPQMTGDDLAWIASRLAAAGMAAAR